MRAVQITRFGGPEVLDVVDLPDPVPGPGQQLYEVSAAGVNFADTHQIENSYLAQQQLPLIPGAEFVGTLVGGGPRVVGLLEGGGYAEKVVAQYPVRALAAVHRVGELGVGDLAVVVAVSCAHRGEAFEACRKLIDDLKHEVPI